jgi:hypothetical protein
MTNKILLIAPRYFNYHNIISEALQQKGYIVDFIEDKNSGFFYTMSMKFTYLRDKFKENHKNKILNKLKEDNYDLIIVIGGRTLDSYFWDTVNNSFKIKKILYQWDSIKNFDYRSLISHFDSVKTFDSEDARNLQIPYLPLFYKNSINQTVDEDLDFVFIGIWHSDRIEILNKIASYAEENNLKYHFKVYHPRYIYLYMRYIKRTIAASPFFTFETVPFKDVINYYKRAKCVVDINHPWQSGLTMRTIETIGSGKKLITTNSFIANEFFYDPKMIQIIDRKKVVIDKNFFSCKENYRNIEKLEISNWIENLLN